jgi:hypothetical protein
MPQKGRYGDLDSGEKLSDSGQELQGIDTLYRNN